MVKVGQKVRFNPLEGINIRGLPRSTEFVIGTVVELHPSHRWFAVEYELGGQPQRTSFNFCDVDETVFLLD